MTELVKPPRPAAFIFIFITILLDMLAIGMVLPVLPKLVESFVGGDTARASEIFGIFGTVWALMQFVSSPVQGALSDRFGRRPVILFSNFGLGFDYMLMALAPNLIWLFIGRVISGIAAASISTGFSYVADVTPAAERSKKFGMLGAAFGVGFVIGPALGGILGSVDPRLPFWCAAGASLLNGLYGLFVLPESLPVENRAVFSWRRANPVASLVLLRSHPELTGLAVVNLLGHIAHAVLPTITVLYAGYRYGWDEFAVGLVLAAVGVCAVIVQAGLVGPMVRQFGDRVTLLTGLVFGATGFAVYGLAPTGPWFWAGIPLMALWGFANPSSQGLMSRRVGPSEQGRLQGANSSLQGIGSLIGPGTFSVTFAYAIGTGKDWGLPGTPFLLASALLLAAVIIAVLVTRDSDS